MSRTPIFLVAVAGLYGALGVAAAAVAAHANPDPRLQTVATFLMLHAAALLGAAGVARAFSIGAPVLWPATGIAVGALLFCGDLSIRVFLGASPIPSAAPFGGTLLILSWFALSVAALATAFRRGS